MIKLHKSNMEVYVMNKIFKDWNLFEKILLFMSIILISISGVITRSEILTVLTSLVSILCALLQAKGKVISQFIGVLVIILYSIVSFQNQYYGEVIIYVLVLLPMYLVGIYSWITNKNEDTNTVKQSSLSKNEWIILGFLNIILFGVLYFILKSLNTSELVISTLSMLASLMANYLIVRRNKYSFLFYIINDMILVILWGIPVLKGDFSLVPLLIEPIILLISDSYGLKNWNKNEKNL